MKAKLKLFAVAAAGLVTGFSAAAASAQPASEASTYPSRAIRMIVPYPPGGGADNVARVIASKLSANLKQTIVVDNRAGASGVIGTAAVVNAPNDGYTLLFTVSSLIQSAALGTPPPYNALKDLSPLSEVAQTNFVLLANTSVPANTLKAFIELAKANPGKFNNGSFGNGTSAHLFGEVLKTMAGIDMTHVPYKGTAPMMLALAGGQIPVGFSDVGAARSFLDSGKLKAFAATGTTRFPILPDVPTFQELGIEGMDLNGWYGLFAPANTNPEIVRKLSREVAGIVRLPEVAATFNNAGIKAVGGTPEAFAASLQQDEPRWTQLIRQTGVTAN